MMMKQLLTGGLLATLVMIAVGCERGPREGQYDPDRHRYYHEHDWHDCADHDEHCR